MDMSDAALPLTGIKVADFSWFGAGPICATAMGYFGADVVRVESETRVDGLRTVLPFATGKLGYNVSGWFNNYNAGKWSITLNLNTPRGTELAHDLVRWADVFLTNFTPSVIERWSLTYDDLVKVKPDIIAAYQPMQGFKGPHRDFLGFGAVLTPIAGFSHLCGFPNRPPVGLGTNYPDYVINPIHTLTAILAALRYRRKTGKGQRIVLAQVESAACALGPAIMDYTVNGRVQTRAGNRSPYAAPHGAFPCLPNKGAGFMGTDEERWCVIAVYTDEEWDALCRVMGDPEWTRDERFATFRGRKENEDEMERLIGAWTGDKTPEEVMERLQAAGVPAAIVQNARDMLERDPHMKERDYYAYLDHPEAGRTAYDTPGFRLSKVQGGFRSPAPCLGEHTEYVCKEILHLSDEEIAQLLIDEVLR
jgi:crotonobetainyl-CoA:carnitine CoA-transferase CaiB-like acyl-CoA transferase